MIWQSPLEYVRIAWDVAHKDEDTTTIYDAIRNNDKVWGVKGLFYHKDGTNTMHWHIRAPNVGLVNHVKSVYKS